MQLSEDEVFENYGKKCGHCHQIMLLPYEFEFTCISCGYNVIKRQNEPSITQRKRMNLINSVKYAELKLFCICADVYKFYEGNDYDKICEILSILKKN